MYVSLDILVYILDSSQPWSTYTYQHIALLSPGEYENSTEKHGKQFPGLIMHTFSGVLVEQKDKWNRKCALELHVDTWEPISHNKNS